MAFFLETLIGGLMAGMLYSLVALGFVLIFKASGVFNFAQGAMVLFAALAMARFSEWIPGWLGIANPVVANVLAFIIAAIIIFTYVRGDSHGGNRAGVLRVVGVVLLAMAVGALAFGDWRSFGDFLVGLFVNDPPPAQP